MEPIGYPATSELTTNLRRVTYQKSDDLEEEVGDNSWQNGDYQYCKTVEQEE